MTIKAKWLGQECTVIAVTDYASTPIFLIAALPGQAFPDGSTMFSAYRPELSDIVTVDNLAAAVEADHDAEYLAGVEYRDEINGLRAGM